MATQELVAGDMATAIHWCFVL